MGDVPRFRLLLPALRTFAGPLYPQVAAEFREADPQARAGGGAGTELTTRADPFTKVSAERLPAPLKRIIEALARDAIAVNQL